MNLFLMAKSWALAICAALVMLGGGSSEANSFSVTGDVNDACVNRIEPGYGGGFNVGDVNEPELPVGRFQDIQDRTAVFPFDLPALRGGTITSATLTLVLRHYLGATHNGDLYGLARTNSSSSVLTNDFFAGPLDGANTRLADNLVTPGGTQYWVEEAHSASGSVLVAFLNAQYAAFGGGHDFDGNDDFIFARVSPDTTAMPDSTEYHFECADRYGSLPALADHRDVASTRHGHRDKVIVEPALEDESYQYSRHKRVAMPLAGWIRASAMREEGRVVTTPHHLTARSLEATPTSRGCLRDMDTHPPKEMESRHEDSIKQNGIARFNWDYKYRVFYL